MNDELKKEIDFEISCISGFRADQTNGTLNCVILSRRIAVLRDRISFFQHERLIHLLVTILFAILAFGGMCALLITELWYLVIIDFLFLVLLVPYVIHYFHLENGVQRLYGLYDELQKIMEESGE
jgi:hypothetical protein